MPPRRVSHHLAVALLPEPGLEVAEEEEDEVGDAGEGRQSEEVDEHPGHEDAEAMAPEHLLPGRDSLGNGT